MLYFITLIQGAYYMQKQDKSITDFTEEELAIRNYVDNIDYSNLTAKEIESYPYTTNEQELLEQLDSYDWKGFVQYTKDSGINIVGLTRPIAIHKVLKEISDNIGITEEDISSIESELSTTQQLIRKIRCKVIPYNPADIARGTLVRNVGNAEVGFVGGSSIIPFNVITHIDAGVVEALKIQQHALTVPVEKDAAGGVLKVKTKLVDSFDIHILPPLTQRQLDKLKLEQSARNQSEE